MEQKEKKEKGDAQFEGLVIFGKSGFQMWQMQHSANVPGRKNKDLF